VQTTWLYAVAHLSNGSVEGWLPENLSIKAGRCCRIFTDGDLSGFEARLWDLGLNDSDERFGLNWINCEALAMRILRYL